MRTALFWDVMQRVVVVSYLHFGTNNGTGRLSQRSVRRYHYSCVIAPKSAFSSTSQASLKSPIVDVFQLR
jgi:hypothetical protein